MYLCLIRNAPIAFEMCVCWGKRAVLARPDLHFFWLSHCDSVTSQKKHTGLLELLMEELDEKNQRRPLTNCQGISSPAEGLLWWEGRKHHSGFLRDTSGTCWGRRQKHTAFSAYRTHKFWLVLPVTTDPYCPRDKRYHLHDPQLLFLLLLDPKVDVKKYSKISCLDYWVGNNGHILLPTRPMKNG